MGVWGGGKGQWGCGGGVLGGGKGQWGVGVEYGVEVRDSGGVGVVWGGGKGQ